MDPKLFSNDGYTWNSHNFAVSPDLFISDHGLSSFWDVTSYSLMPNGTAFVATIESKQYPIFANQFHPEQPSSMFIDNYGVNHTWESVNLNDQFGRFFVKMARSNNNTFGSFAET